MSTLSRGGEWAACAGMVRHALHLYASENGVRHTRAFVGVAFAFLILALIGSSRFFAPCMIAVCVFFALQVQLGWMVLFKSLMKQNAGAGVLVPGIGRRSMLVLALAFFVAVVCVTTPAAIFGLPVVMTGLFIALVLVLAALLMVRPALAALAVASVVAPRLIERFLMPLDQVIAVGVPLLVGILAAVVAVRALLGGRMTSPFARAGMQYDETQQVRRATAGYAKVLKRDSDRRDPALLLHCLGPVAAQQLVEPALLLALGIGVAIALSLFVPALAGHAHVGVPLAVVSVILTQLYMVVMAVRRTAGEQALVMLAPHRPEGAGLNQLLARTLILRYGYTWLMLMLMLIVVSAIFGAGAAELVWLLAILMITLAAGSLMLQDYAKADQGRSILPILLGVGAAGTLLAAAVTRVSLAAGGAFVVAWTLVALVCYVLRWQAMLRAPVAFPARRMCT